MAEIPSLANLGDVTLIVQVPGRNREPSRAMFTVARRAFTASAPKRAKLGLEGLAKKVRQTQRRGFKISIRDSTPFSRSTCPRPAC
jgi:hypothetical protein